MKLEKLFKIYVYFRRGHSVYLVFFLSLANFIMICTLVLRNILYVALVLAIYVPLAITVGYFDYKKGCAKTEAQVHPFWSDLAKALYLICLDKREEAKKVLEKWVGDSK